jgi:hypothetical protein
MREELENEAMTFDCQYIRIQNQHVVDAAMQLFFLAI